MTLSNLLLNIVSYSSHFSFILKPLVYPTLKSGLTHTQILFHTLVSFNALSFVLTHAKIEYHTQSFVYLTLNSMSNQQSKLCLTHSQIYV